MTGYLVLDWATMSVSLLNTILLFWLGLTVLLNAERRTRRPGRWGVWVAGGGLLMGSAFFVSHSSILGHDLRYVTFGIEFWWRVGWVPVVALPFAWYAIMLWYAGFWAAGLSPMKRRHRLWFPLIVVLALGQVLSFLSATGLPSYVQVTQLQWPATLSVAGMPLLFLLYPLYAVGCILLSLDVLSRPGLAGRMMGDAARRRARPWLVSTSLVLLLVSLLVGAGMAWILNRVGRRPDSILYGEMALTLTWLDLSISSSITLSVLLLGRAIVAYELFTGRVLPRRGFLRHWRNVVFLALGYSLLVGWALVIQLRPIYSLLLTAVLMVSFYALLNWRSFAERERTMAQLRPFAASQRLYESVVASTRSDMDTAALFGSLCGDLLGARQAWLVPMGSLAPLLGAPIVYPEGQSLPRSPIPEIAPHAAYMPLDPARADGAALAVPLWSERGLSGVLLLGEKRDGGLYAEEEIQVARAGSERLLDTLAAVEAARRLMALLRQRVAQVRVMEGQGRRVLHDQVLPQLHTAILYLHAVQHDPAVGQAIEALTAAHHEIADLMRDTIHAAPEYLAEQGLIPALRTLVETDYAGQFTGIHWQVGAQAEVFVRELPLFVAQVVFFAAQELIRNAARHGRGGQPGRALQLQIVVEAVDGVRLSVQDDGIGFQPALWPDTEPAAEGGQGLRFHSTMLAALGARLEVTSSPESGTTGTIHIPPTVMYEFIQTAA